MKGIRIVITNNCNIMCGNCINKCGPNKRGIMEPGDFNRRVMEAYESGFKDYIIIQGGEPFLHTGMLYKYLKKLRNINMKKHVVTNGFWGDVEPFFDILEELKKIGLDSIIIGYDYYHSVYIPEKVIEGAIEKILLNGFELGIKSTFKTDGITDEFDKRTFEIIKGMKSKYKEARFIFEKMEMDKETITCKNEKFINYIE